MVLYEASFNFSIWLFVPLFMSVFAFIVPCRKEYRGQKLTVSHGARIFCYIIAVFLFICFAVTLLFHVDMYNKTVGAYKDGEYQTVEGYVENFEPMSDDGRGNESFEINGVRFSYSDNDIIQGYNDANGVITGNGQHLKIGYVYFNEEYGNIIVYIEELD